VRSEDISDELEQTPASTGAHGEAKTSGSQGRGRGPDSKPEFAWGQDTANHTSRRASTHCGTAIRVHLPRPSGEFNQFIDVIPDSALSRHRPTNGIRAAVDAAFGF